MSNMGKANMFKILALLAIMIPLGACSIFGGESSPKSPDDDDSSTPGATSGPTITTSRLTTAPGAHVDGIAAVVNGDIITIRQVENRVNVMANTSKGAGMPREQVKKVVLGGLINQELMNQAAKKKGVYIAESDVDKTIASIMAENKLTKEQFEASLVKNGSTVQAFRDDIKVELLRNRVMGTQMASKVVVTEKEILKFLNGEGPKMGNALRPGGAPDNRPLRIIFIPLDPKNKEGSVAVANKIKKEIDSGSLTFAQAAAKYSRGPGRDNGGDAGDGATVGSLPPPIQAALASIKPGEASEPLVAGNAVAILSVGEGGEPTPKAPEETIKKASIDDFSAEEKDNARRQLEVFKMQQRYAEWVADLKRNAVIRINI